MIPKTLNLEKLANFIEPEKGSDPGKSHVRGYRDLKDASDCIRTLNDIKEWASTTVKLRAGGLMDTYNKGAIKGQRAAANAVLTSLHGPNWEKLTNLELVVKLRNYASQCDGIDSEYFLEAAERLARFDRKEREQDKTNE